MFYFFFHFDDPVERAKAAPMKNRHYKVREIKADEPSLYGIRCSNRDFSDPKFWGKNQFNSAFPTALACYMRDQGIEANYIREIAQNKTEVSTISFDKVFGTTLPNHDLCFLSKSLFLNLHIELNIIPLPQAAKQQTEFQ